MTPSYHHQVQAALDFIEEHLDRSGELSNEAVAAQVGFSPYHFHRIFSATLGQSVCDYVRQRRLSRAAELLVHSDTAIIELALACDFETQESFTRAFKKSFGITPGAFRRRGPTQSWTKKPKDSPDLFRHLPGGITMKPEFVRREEEYVIGLGASFTQGNFKEISQLWQRFQERREEIKMVKPNCALGVCLSSHPEIEKQPGHTFIYIAGLPVTELIDVPQGMVVVKLATAKYARFTHTGPLKEVTSTVEYIWGTWLPNSGYAHRDCPDFELYDERFDPHTLSGAFDIYVAVHEHSSLAVV